MDDQSKSRHFNPNIIYLLLGTVILVELFLGLRELTQPTPSPLPARESKPLTGASIVLTSPKKEYSLGETIPVSVLVSTGGHVTDGTDLVLKYNPKIIEASKPALSKGTIYNEYPSILVDSKLGVVRISGIASASKNGFNGVGVFVTLDLKAKQAGNTTLTVDFKKGSTTDSNVVETKTGTDLLEEVRNLNLTIK